MLHHLVAKDAGLPHDHPCQFETTILKGSYLERVYQVTGEFEDILHKQGSTYTILPERIHSIIELPDGECWSLVFAGPVVREWKHWNKQDFKLTKKMIYENTNSTGNADAAICWGAEV